MHHHQRTATLRRGEDLKQLPVVQHQIIIGHEDLERGIAIGNEAGQLLIDNRWRGIGDDEMKAIITQGNAIGFLVIIDHRLAQGLPARLQREGQHRGVAARQSAARSAFKAIGHFRPTEGGLGEVHMTVDAARHHEEPGMRRLPGSALDAVGTTMRPTSGPTSAGRCRGGWRRRAHAMVRSVFWHHGLPGLIIILRNRADAQAGTAHPRTPARGSFRCHPVAA